MNKSIYLRSRLNAQLGRIDWFRTFRCQDKKTSFSPSLSLSLILSLSQQGQSRASFIWGSLKMRPSVRLSCPNWIEHRSFCACVDEVLRICLRIIRAHVQVMHDPSTMSVEGSLFRETSIPRKKYAKYSPGGSCPKMSLISWKSSALRNNFPPISDLLLEDGPVGPHTYRHHHLHHHHHAHP